MTPGTLGDDTITASETGSGGGSDTVVFAGNKADYSLVFSADGSVIVTDNRGTATNDGTDTLTNIENIRFADSVLSTGPVALAAFIPTDAAHVQPDAGIFTI